MISRLISSQHISGAPFWETDAKGHIGFVFITSSLLHVDEVEVVAE
jgi:hypothetical protein